MPIAPAWEALQESLHVNQLQQPWPIHSQRRSIHFPVVERGRQMMRDLCVDSYNQTTEMVQHPLASEASICSKESYDDKEALVTYLTRRHANRLFAAVSDLFMACV